MWWLLYERASIRDWIRITHIYQILANSKQCREDRNKEVSWNENMCTRLTAVHCVCFTFSMMTLLFQITAADSTFFYYTQLYYLSEYSAQSLLPHFGCFSNISWCQIQSLFGLRSFSRQTKLNCLIMWSRWGKLQAFHCCDDDWELIESDRRVLQRESKTLVASVALNIEVIIARSRLQMDINCGWISNEKCSRFTLLELGHFIHLYFLSYIFRIITE